MGVNRCSFRHPATGAAHAKPLRDSQFLALFALLLVAQPAFRLRCPTGATITSACSRHLCGGPSR